MPPLASFGLPVYNGERFIAATIESILNQTETAFELIVSDNASTDSTLKIVQEYAGCDSRVRVLRQNSNIGAVANFQAVLQAAHGTYFAWAGDHDFYNRRWLEECIDAFDEHPNAVLAYPWYGGISMAGDELYRHRASFNTLGMNVWQRIAAVTDMRGGGSRIYGCFRREALRQVRVHPCAWWDRLFLTSLAAHGEFVQIERVLWFRRHSNWRETSDKSTLVLRTLQHQLRTIHPNGKPPIHCRIPTLWHLVCLIYDLAVAPPDGIYSPKRIGIALYAITKHFDRMKEHFRIEANLAFRGAPTPAVGS